MSSRTGARRRAESAPVCGVGAQGFKCAVVSWLMPLVAIAALVAGLHYPVVRVFNIVFVAFGLTALARSVAHIREYGSCGLGGHVAVGLLLNVLIVALVVVYVFTGLDPIRIRP